LGREGRDVQAFGTSDGLGKDAFGLDPVGQEPVGLPAHSLLEFKAPPVGRRRGWTNMGGGLTA
jgi:hypothetical protein